MKLGVCIRCGFRELVASDFVCEKCLYHEAMGWAPRVAPRLVATNRMGEPLPPNAAGKEAA